jgi:hypothetical protein
MHVMSPRPPWLAALPNHPARRLVRRIILGCWIGIPVLPLLAFPFVQPPGLVVLLSLLLAALSAIMYLAVGCLLKLLGMLQQYCPRCYSAMHIGAQVCPACQFTADTTPTRELSSHQFQVIVIGSLLSGLTVVGSGVANAGGTRYFACPIVSYFIDACAEIVMQEAPSVAPVTTAPSSEDSLFTPQTVSRDTPPLMLRLLQEPTVANALAYVRWQRQRLERVREVQALVKQVMAADQAAPESSATDSISPEHGQPRTGSPTDR